MCGIVVGMCFGKLSARKEKVRQKLLRYFTTELLLQTEARGKDATGAAVLFNDGNFVGIKRGERSSSFLAKFGESKEYYGGFLKVWQETASPAKIYLGHCRAGTTGSKLINANNHPIKIGNIVGIHNGVIRNYKEIIKHLNCKQDGEVDSEAIFRLIHNFTNSGKEPFTLDMLQEVVNRLDGQFAVTMFNADNLFQIPFFRDGRPVEFVLLKEYGILLAISELKFWRQVFFDYERAVHYNKELHNIKLPSLIGDNKIDLKTLEDDSAIIFDLSKNVDEDTKITDLGEWRKMVRTNKIWKSKSNVYTGNYHRCGYTGYNRYSGANNNINKNTNVNEKKTETNKSSSVPPKRRVFDSITKKYITKGGDEDVSKTETITIPVSNAVEDKTKNADIKTNNTTSSTTAVVPIKKTSGVKVATIDVDDLGEIRGKKAEILDSTHYQVEQDKSKSSDNKVAVPDKVINVDMKTLPAIIVEKSQEAYQATDLEERGYKDVEDLLSDIEIGSVETAKLLGITILANRIAKNNWIRGYQAALMDRSVDDEHMSRESKNVEKEKRRERYISQLRSMIVILCKGYNKASSTSPFSQHTIREALKESTLHARESVDMEVISSIVGTSIVEAPNSPLKIVKEAITYKNAIESEQEGGEM